MINFSNDDLKKVLFSYLLIANILLWGIIILENTNGS